MTDLIHISAIEKYFSKIMKMDKDKVRVTLEYIQRINKICPHCKDNISEPEHSCKGIEDAYYSDKYNLLFCCQSCAEVYNQEKCVMCKDNLTAVNCELCNFSLCENCHKTDDKYSWYCEDCYTIKKCNEDSDDDNDDEDDDDECSDYCERSYDLKKCDVCKNLYCSNHRGYCNNCKKTICDDCEYNNCECYKKIVQCYICNKKVSKLNIEVATPDIIKNFNNYYICIECCDKKHFKKCDVCFKYGGNNYLHSVKGPSNSTHNFNICEICIKDPISIKSIERRVWNLSW